MFKSEVLIAHPFLDYKDAFDRRIPDWYGVHQEIATAFVTNPESNDQSERASPTRYLYKASGLGGVDDFSKVTVFSHVAPRPGVLNIDAVRSREITDDSAYWKNDLYNFSVVMNTAHTCKQKIVAVHNEDLVQWFIEKMSNHGMSCLQNTLNIERMQSMIFRKTDGHTPTIARALFQGRFRVTNRDAFIDTCKNGLGRALSFGCGYLCVEPIIEY